MCTRVKWSNRAAGPGMPDRVIRSADGFYGGLLIILGVYYLGMAYSWAVTPSESRVAGISWLAIPDWAVHPSTIAVLWAVAGVVCVAGGALSRVKAAELAAGLVAVLIPFIIGALFASAWVLTGYGKADAPTGLVTAWSYWLPAVIAGWGMIRAPRHVAVQIGGAHAD